jgi:nitrite reductase/ring-hydroxylating ferredoxin subunit
LKDDQTDALAESGAKEETERNWHKVAEPGKPDDGSVIQVTAGTKSVALSRIDGTVSAIDGTCPHQGGPLGDGTIEGDCVRCPWHGWDFDARTGKSPDGDDAVDTYEVEEREDGVYVAVEEAVKIIRTISNVMVETMTNWGVKHVFGMVGHSNLGLADAVRAAEEDGNLTFIGIRHEGAAAFACSAYAKLTGKPAACLTIAGPGATNLLTGLWDAHVDRAPVLALTGQVNTQVLGPGAFQEIDQASAFEAVSAWSQTVLHSSNHAELMTLALKHAIVERGVSHLIFPDEVQILEAAEDAAPSGPEGRMAKVAITPDAQSVGKALDRIRNAKHPAIIVDTGQANRWVR